MSAPEFAMLVIAALASVAAGLVYAMLARDKPGFVAAKVLSWASALGFGSLGVIWGATNITYPLGWRVVAGAALGAIVCGALVWALADISGQSKPPLPQGSHHIPRAHTAGADQDTPAVVLVPRPEQPHRSAHMTDAHRPHTSTPAAERPVVSGDCSGNTVSGTGNSQTNNCGQEPEQ